MIAPVNGNGSHNGLFQRTRTSAMQGCNPRNWRPNRCLMTIR